MSHGERGALIPLECLWDLRWQRIDFPPPSRGDTVWWMRLSACWRDLQAAAEGSAHKFVRGARVSVGR